MTDPYVEIPLSEFERLHDQIRDLQAQNARLRAVIAAHVQANHDPGRQTCRRVGNQDENDVTRVTATTELSVRDETAG
jgi:hypothetical protein